MRFIPAHAGNILPSTMTSVWVPVHPRARGEHMVGVPERDHGAGSSPRTRGTSLTSCGMAVLTRFIPAHAGNIRRLGLSPVQRPVHPRARGEHGKADASIRNWLGSSPRTRGTCPTH